MKLSSLGSFVAGARISDVKVTLTMVGGKAVFQAINGAFVNLHDATALGTKL